MLLAAQVAEEQYRTTFRAEVSERIARAGGWGIDFSNVTTAPTMTHQLLLPGGEAPIKVVDGALPASWCDRFIAVHTEAGFTPQHVLDVTVGSPLAIATSMIVGGARIASATNPNSRNFQPRGPAPANSGDLQSRAPSSTDDDQAAAEHEEHEEHDEHDEHEGVGYSSRKNTAEVVEVVSPRFAAALWQRMAPFVPAVIHSRGDMVSEEGTAWRAVGIIPTFRFMRYTPGQAFKPHHDPARLAGVDPVSGASGRFKSLVTLALYLNDAEEFGGGGLHFVKLVPNPASTGKALIGEPIATVTPKRGRCAVFEHSRLHESEAIASGTKHMVQCDVLYQLHS
jgi:hypothetical protein